MKNFDLLPNSSFDIKNQPILRTVWFFVCLEAPPGFEPGIKALQASALPLGDGADNFGILVIWVMDVKRGSINPCGFVEQ
jgi:hypothetical protein